MFFLYYNTFIITWYNLRIRWSFPYPVYSYRWLLVEQQMTRPKNLRILTQEEFNDGSDKYVRPGNGSFSAINLLLLIHLSWKSMI